MDQISEANENSSYLEDLRSNALEFSKATTADQVEAMVARLDPISSLTIRGSWPLQKDDDPNAWGLKIAAGLLALKPGPHREANDAFLEVIDLDELDNSLACIERLDAMIDRTIKRLMQVKTMKQMHDRLEPKLINLSATKNLPI